MGKINLESNSFSSLKSKKIEAVTNQEKKNGDLNGEFTPYFLFCLIICSVGSFQFGWNMGVFNVPAEVVKDFYNEVYLERNNLTMSNSTLNLLWSWTNALFPLGGVIGGLGSGFAADFFGRKNGLIYTNILVIITGAMNIMSIYIRSYETIMVGRFFAGVFSGLFSGLVPMYLNEIAPKNLKGLAGTMNRLLLVGGILITNIFGLVEILGSRKFLPFLVGFILVPLVFHFGLFLTVETPKYLYFKDKIEEARKALVKLRGSSASELIQNEIDELEEEKQKLLEQKVVSWKNLFTERHLIRPLIVTIMVQTSQQFSGINAVVFYSSSIFSSIVEQPWPNYITIGIALIQLIMTFVCMAIIDKSGRKVLMLSGTIGMCLFSFVIGASILFKTPSWLNYVTIASVLIYIVFFSIGPGPIPWLLTSELFASDARGKATSIAVFVNWFTNFLVTLLFPIVNEAIGAYSFLIFGNLLIIFSLYIYFFVPETKNKSPDEIIELFKNHLLFHR